ncbi:MAG: HD domain-containing protein [Candidatus Saccharibacteria bacterium]|nr:HD domain-containing protein [Candidatus Saccharibacteria bacterium]
MQHLSASGYDETLIQKAIVYLTARFSESGNNPKPVILHSIRVATTLWSNGAPQVSVIAALLHDLLEDTDTTHADIAKRFGTDVADIVRSLTIEKGQASYDVRLQAAVDSFECSNSIGYDALIVRAADLIDNSYYYHKASYEQIDLLYRKYKKFMGISQNTIKPSVFWVLLQDNYDKNVRPLRTHAAKQRTPFYKL